MSTIHEWSPPDVGQLSQELHERLGVEDAASVVGSLLDLSERLWQPGSDRSEPDTFHSLIGRDRPTPSSRCSSPTPGAWILGRRSDSSTFAVTKDSDGDGRRRRHW
jgi:hypothetical protein